MKHLYLKFRRAGVLLVFAALSAGSVGAQGRPAQPTGSLVGRVLDAETGQPVAGAQVRLRELARADLSHDQGDFHFERVPAGSYTITVQRVGYAPLQQSARVTAGDTSRVTLQVRSSAIEVAAIVVTGTGRERGAADVYRPVAVLSGAELRRQLGATVTATVATQPGIAQRYNGPAASQPVIRGLSGDRVLVLEDGHRTGDIAGSAADHGVIVEPLTAERVEIVRGPAALLYGSNALGGVINVIREEVPRSLPDRLSGTLSSQLESVNRGAVAGGALLGAAGPVAWRGEISARAAGDTHTPLGELPTTDFRGYNGSVGASWIFPGAYAGLALRDQGMRYGVPGEFNGQRIVGAHEGGVYIDTRRTAIRGEGALLSGIGPFRAAELEANYTRFQQDELEQVEGRDMLGNEFDQQLGTVNLLARHEHDAGLLRIEGAVGVWASARELIVRGLSTGTRSARQASVAGFGYEEFGRGPFRIELGARYDWTRITPLRGGMIRGEPVRTRDFGALSGSLAGIVLPGGGWSGGVRIARAFRTPSVEELFSNGPHLAAYEFNVGNPSLKAEFGVGTDVFLRLEQRRLNLDATVFHNAFDNFIYNVPTGRLDPRVGEVPEYQSQQADARTWGAEGRIQWEPLRRLALDARASYVRGELVESGDALPALPPLNGGVQIRYDSPGYFVGAGWTAASSQTRIASLAGDQLVGGAGTPRCREASLRIPANSFATECPTAGYALLDVGAGLRWTQGARLHSLTLQVDNAADTEWRDHLSRIKEFAPQPGRNVRLLYRIDF